MKINLKNECVLTYSSKLINIFVYYFSLYHKDKEIRIFYALRSWHWYHKAEEYFEFSWPSCLLIMISWYKISMGNYYIFSFLFILFLFCFILYLGCQQEYFWGHVSSLSNSYWWVNILILTYLRAWLYIY